MNRDVCEHGNPEPCGKCMPEALRLADWCKTWNTQQHDKAAAELRRLHTLNGELLEALKRIDKEFRKYGRQHWPEAEKARSAIAKAEGTA
jgi:hypothetical protein